MNPARVALGASLAGAVALALCAVVDPAAAARGWLTAFVFCSGPLIGAVVLRLINRLTGGAWGEAPGLVTLGRASVWLWAMGIPVLLLLPLIYPWAAAPTSTPHQLSAYLSTSLFVARSAAILIGWSLLAPGARRFTGQGFAGAGLVFYGLTVGFAAADWTLSTVPGWISSAAGMALAVRELTAAGAVVLVLGAGRLEKRTEGDIAGLVCATLVADLYFNLMIYLVAWYGDLPAATAWSRLREGPGWSALIAAALVIGDVAPLLVLATGRRWIGRLTGPVAGAFALAGQALQTVWMTAPQLGLAAVAPAGAAAALIAGLLALAVLVPHRRKEAAHGV